MPTSARSAICCTSCSVAMFHPDNVVYVILYGHFITIFTGKLLQYLPDTAAVLHRFLLVPGEFCRDVAFGNLPEGNFPAPSLHLVRSRYRPCSAHYPHIHVGHRKVRTMEGGNCLVTVGLLFEPGKVLFEILLKGCCFEIPGISAKEFICPLPGDDPPVALLSPPAGDKILGQGDAHTERILFRDYPDDTGK